MQNTTNLEESKFGHSSSEFSFIWHLPEAPAFSLERCFFYGHTHLFLLAPVNVCQGQRPQSLLNNTAYRKQAGEHPRRGKGWYVTWALDMKMPLYGVTITYLWSVLGEQSVISETKHPPPHSEHFFPVYFYIFSLNFLFIPQEIIVFATLPS